MCKGGCRPAGQAGADLVDGIEHVAQLALLVRAERGVVDEVEEQLFWFGRILDAQPRLTILLSDYTAPASSRVKLLNDILEDPFDVNPLMGRLFRRPSSCRAVSAPTRPSWTENSR